MKNQQERLFFFEKKNQRAFSLLIFLVASPFLIGAGAVPRDPDWPCQQVKVSALSLGSFWNGPAVDLSADWRHATDVAALVGAVTQRRLPIDQAVQTIKDFVRTLPAGKNAKLTLLVAGIFDVLDRERTELLAGLDRFGQRQKVLAEGLREDGETLRAAQADPAQDDTKRTALTQQLLWDQQVFESRRQSLSFACDVPTAIEQRLFGLTKAIQEQLE